MLITIISYAATILIALLSITKRISFTISAIIQFRFISDIIVWGVINLCWLKFEGNFMPITAFVLSILSIAATFGLMKNHVDHEKQRDMKITVSREIWAIVIVMVIIIIKEGPIRWY